MIRILLDNIIKFFKFFFLGLTLFCWGLFNIIYTLFQWLKFAFYLAFFWLVFVFQNNALLKAIWFECFLYVFKLIYLHSHRKLLASSSVYFTFSVSVHVKWPLLKPLLVELIDFVFKKIKLWFSYILNEGKLPLLDTSGTFTFFLYIYVFLLFYAFLFFLFFFLLGLYLNILFIFFIFFIIYFVSHFFFYFFSHLFSNVITYYFEFLFLDFIYFSNFFTGYLNSMWMFYFKPKLEKKKYPYIKPDFGKEDALEAHLHGLFNKKGLYTTFVSYMSLFLMSINLNNAKMITYLKRNGILNIEPENLEHLPGHEEHYFRNLEYNAYQLKDSHNLQNRFLNMPFKKSSTNFSFLKNLMIQHLVENFLKSDQFTFFTKTRNLVSKTKYPGTPYEFKSFLAFYKNSGMTSRAFDLIASTTWAEKMEDQLLRSRFYLEARYAYFSRHNRNPLLIYNFFRHGVLPVNFWSIFYSKMKRARNLGRKIDRAIQIASGYPEISKQLGNIHYPSRVRKQEIPLELSSSLKKQQLLLTKKGIFVEDYKGLIEAPVAKKPEANVTSTSNFSRILKLISVDVPIAFSFLTNLNYLVLVLFGELFGDFLFKQVHFASNLYNIRTKIEQHTIFSFKIKRFSRIFSFIFFDFWFLCLRLILVFFYFIKFNMFKANLLWYLLSTSLQLMVFFLQALKINDRSALAYLYVFFYKDFFKFKLKGKTAHRVLKGWGIGGVIMETIVFLFSFIVLIVVDLFVVFSKLLLKIKFFAYLFYSLKFFSISLFKFFYTNIFNPFYFVMLYCEDFDLDSRRFKKQNGLNVYGKGPQVFEPIEIFFIGFVFWKTLLNKYWWGLFIEHEVGIKRWPFFYKLAKRAPWFDRFSDILYDFQCFLWYVYYKTIFVIYSWFKKWVCIFYYTPKFSLRYLYSTVFSGIIFILFNFFSFVFFIKRWVFKFLHSKQIEQIEQNTHVSLDYTSLYKWLLTKNRKIRTRINFLNKQQNSKVMFKYKQSRYHMTTHETTFVIKLKEFYQSLEKKKANLVENFWIKNVPHQTKASVSASQLVRKSAVNSLYVIHGYTSQIHGGKDIIHNEDNLNVMMLRKILWSHGFARFSNIISTNLKSSLSFCTQTLKKKHKASIYFKYNEKFFPLDIFLTSNLQYKSILQSRLNTLKSFTYEFNQIKSNSKFSILDKYYFSFFCSFWEQKLEDFSFFNVYDLNKSNDAEFNSNQFSDISHILLKAHELRFTNLKQFFESHKNINSTDKFTSFLKLNISKNFLYNYKSHDDSSDFVTFYQRLAQFDIFNFFSKGAKSEVGLKLFFKGYQNYTASNPAFKQNSYRSIFQKTFAIEKYDQWVKIFSIPKRVYFIVYVYHIKFRIIERVLAASPVWSFKLYCESKFNKLVNYLTVNFKIKKQYFQRTHWSLKKERFRERLLKISKSTQRKLLVTLLLKKVNPSDENSIFNSIFFQFLLRKLLLLYVWFLCVFQISLKHQPKIVKSILSRIFYLLWQITVFGTFSTKFLFNFWAVLLKESLFFYTGFFYVQLFKTQLYTHKKRFNFVAEIFSVTLYRYYERTLEEGSFLRGIPAEEYRWRGNLVYSFDIYRHIVDEFLDVVIRTRVSAVKLKKKGELISDKELFWRNFLKQEQGLLSREDRPDSYVATAFQVQGNIIARSRAYAIYRSLMLATSLRFYYQKIILGYDDKSRVNIFLEEYPEFRDLFVDNEDVKTWRKRYETKWEEKQAKSRRGYYYDKAFLNILPDIWFVARRFMKFKLWKDHLLLKMWLWFSTTSNFQTNILFFVVFVITLGFGFVNLFTMNGLITIFSVIFSYVFFLADTVLWLLESLCFYLFGFSWAAFREMFENFFYYVALYPDLQSTLLSLGLYDVFLFFMNNFVLYEAEVFVKERIIWISITTAWIVVNSICFNLLTLPLLLLNIICNDLYFVGFFTFFSYFDLHWIILSLKGKFIFCLDTYILFISYILYQLIPSIFWQFFFFFQYGLDYLLVCFLTIKSFYIDVDPLLWDIMHPLAWKYLPSDIMYHMTYLAYNWKELLYVMIYDLYYELIWQLGWIFYFADIVVELYELLTIFVFKPMLQGLVIIGFKSLYPIYAIASPIFIIITHGFMLICVEILIKLLDVFIYVDFGLKFLVEFFFEDVSLQDFGVFLLHSFIWMYSNFIYYFILTPFMYLVFGFIELLKFICILPIEFFTILEVFFTNLYTALLVCFKLPFSIFEGWFNFVKLFESFFESLRMNENYNAIHNVLHYCLNFILAIVLFPFKILSVFFTQIINFSSPLFLFNICLKKLIVVIEEFGFLFYILGKESILLFVLILQTLFGFFSNFFLSLISFFWLFIEVLDAFFPSLKHVFNPIGGVSIFYATFYYYFFIFTCYVWSLSFRAFNDTTREPPLPSEVWPEIVEKIEDHPVIQHLPFDVYQLLYSEKLSTRKGLPPKLDQSLRSWLPSKHQPNLAKLTQVKTTPLNVQGYYYVFLNQLARKAVSSYYKTKKQVLLRTKERYFRSLGIKEFLHFLRDLPLDILDATSEFLRFEWKTEKPIFERDAKTPLGQRLNLPMIMQSFELIFPKDVQHRRRRDSQIFEQLLADRFGSGQADEIIWSFPILGKIFNIRTPIEQQRYFKIEVLKAGWKHGYDAKLTPAQREIKKKLILHWILKSRDIGFTLESFEMQKWKNGQAAMRHMLANEVTSSIERDIYDFENEMGGSLQRSSSENFKKSEALRRYTAQVEKDLDKFHIKRYEKIAVITDRDGETIADPLFLAVRALDLFLYPVLVFATVNTGWWYSSNGMMDATMRYVELENYASEMAEVFENDMDMDALFSDKEAFLRKLGSDKVSNMVLFDSKEAVDLFFPTQQTVDWFWNKFVKEHPELNTDFNLLMEQDPYYFLQTASSYMTKSLQTDPLGRKDPWVDYLYKFWKNKKDTMIYAPTDPVIENSYNNIDSILDSIQNIKSDITYEKKSVDNVFTDFKLKGVDKSYNYKQKWREFLSNADSEDNDFKTTLFDTTRLKFLAEIFNEDFLGYTLYVASDFDIKRYEMSGAYFFSDWHNKKEIIDYQVVEDDEVTKLKRLYDKVTEDQAKEQLAKNVAALRKLAEEEGLDTESQESRRLLLQYALDHNLVKFEIEDEEQRKFAKILQEGGGDQFTDEELDELHKKAKERFDSAFFEIFTAFDGPQKEEEKALQKQRLEKREEKLKWFYDQLKRFKPAEHPLNQKHAIEDLMFVYHNFQRDPGFWFWSNPVLYKGLVPLYKTYFDHLDRRNVLTYNIEEEQKSSTLLMKPYKDFLDYHFLEDYINPKMQYNTQLLNSIRQAPITITRSQPYPYGFQFLDIIEHRYNITRPYSHIQEYLDLLRESEISVYEAKGMDPRFTAKFHVDVDLFKEEVLFGEVFYKYHTSGFLSLFENDTLKWFLWGFYKIYEGSVFGDFVHKLFIGLFANSLMFGPSVLPAMIKNLDPDTKMLLFDRFGHGDLIPLKWDFYSPYTGFTFYNHNEQILNKRGALLYFSKPGQFSDQWFLQNITTNPFIAANVLTEHMKHASYERSSIFHTSEMTIQLTSFFKRYLSEEIKLFIRFGLYIWMYATEFIDILGDYFSTYALLRSLYDLVITPVVLFYNISKSIYFLLNEMGFRIYQAYAYFKINLRIAETLSYVFNLFVIQPVIGFSFFFVQVFNWGLKQICTSFYTDFLIDMGFDTWWKRTLIRHVFLSLGPSLEFIHFSYFLNPMKLFLYVKKRFWEYTAVLWNMQKMYSIWTIPDGFFKGPDTYLQLAWVRGIQWVGVGAKHYSEIRYTILQYSFLWLMLDRWLKFTVTPLAFSFYNLSDWNYSSWQILWQMTSPHWFFTKLHIQAPFSINHFLIMVFDKLDVYLPVYDNLETIIKQLTLDAYNTQTDRRFLNEWQPQSFEESHSQWALVLSLADLQGFDKTYKDYFGYFNYAAYETREANKAFVKLRSMEGMPFLLRESVEAPYSLAISDALIVLSKAEQQYLSKRAINSVFSNENFYAFDFLKEYNDSFAKSDYNFKLTMRQWFSDFRFWNAYGFVNSPADVSLRTAFTYDVSQNFYSNMRSYEEELGINKLRYFFHRYQWLIQDVFTYKNDMTKLSDLFVEMVFERGVFDVMHMRFSNTKQIPTSLGSPLEQTPVLRISMDVYGNFVYCLEGPDWFINPERSETEVFVNDLLDPVLDDLAGFMINKAYPSFKTSFWFVFDKMAAVENKLFPRATYPSKLMIKLLVDLEERHGGVINPEYVVSFGGTMTYRVKDYLGEDFKSPGAIRQEREEWKKQQAEELKALKDVENKKYEELAAISSTMDDIGFTFNYNFEMPQEYHQTTDDIEENMPSENIQSLSDLSINIEEQKEDKN